MKVKRLIPIVLSLLMVGTLFAGCGDKPQGDTGDTGNQGEQGDQGGEVTLAPLPAENKIYVVGDSTVCEYKDKNDPTKPQDKYFLPRYGYGTQLSKYLNVTDDQVVNLALSGRSSKSFLTEANYTTLTDSIKEGDYLIIGFGHNDEKSDDPARYTTAKDSDTYTTEGSFEKTLYDNYVKMATDKGATPILCTPIVRYSATADYSGAKAHITTDGDYAKAIRDLGEDTNTTVVDLTALTKELYSSNNGNAIYYHAHPTYKGEIKDPPYVGTEVPSGRDDTHINKYGAKMVAYQFATALKSSKCSLRAHVREDISKPTKRVDYRDAIWQEYKKFPYVVFDSSSDEAAEAKLVGDWYKTCMGDLGGESVTPFTIESTSATAFSITCTGGKGKISSDADGFAAAFRQISLNDNFKASATVTIKTMGEPKQAAFGMMLRDDIYMNKTAKGGLVLNTNYVAAGALTNEKTADTAIFSRESNALNKSDNEVELAVDQQIEISITRVGQAVTVKFGDSTQVFTDFDFRSTDNEYMYLCLFATRNFEVEFTNVQFEVTGVSQGA